MWIVLLALNTSRAADNLSELQEQALKIHPTLEARRSRVVEIEELARVAGAWTDPVVGVEYSNAPVNSLSLAQHPMSGVQLKVQQKLRPLGWSGAKRDAVGATAEAARGDVGESELQLELLVARSWWLLVRVRQTRALTEAHLQRIANLREAVTSRYQVGEAGQSSVLRLQVLEDRLSDDLLEFDRDEAALVASLKRATGFESFETPDISEPIAAPDASEWEKIALDTRPVFERLDAMEASAEARVRVAKAEALPDPSVWAGYRMRLVQTATDPGTDFVSVGVGVPIPTGSGRRARGEKAAQLQVIEQVRRKREAMEDFIEAETIRISSDWERAFSKSTNYSTSLIPSAQSVLESTTTDFSVGRAGFASLMEAEIALLELDRTLVKATTSTHISHAEANALIGTEPAPAGDAQ